MVAVLVQLRQKQLSTVHDTFFVAYNSDKNPLINVTSILLRNLYYEIIIHMLLVQGAA